MMSYVKWTLITVIALAIFMPMWDMVSLVG